MIQYIEILQNIHKITNNTEIQKAELTLKFSDLKKFQLFKNLLANFLISSKENIIQNTKQDNNLHLIITFEEIQKIKIDDLLLKNLNLKQKTIKFKENEK